MPHMLAPLAGSASARAATALSSRSRRAPAAVRAMAAPAGVLKVWVKGDPATGELLDCMFCQRVLITLQQKSIPHSLGLVDFGAKPAWLAERSGGKVPVINVGEDFWLPDSDAIVEWLEATYPAPCMTPTAPPEL